MKKIKLLMMTLLITVLAVGCSKGSEQGGETGETSPKQIITKIQETLSKAYDTPLEDGVLSGYHLTDMTNEEEMFKYEVILNGIYNKTKIEGEYKKFVYETQDAIQYLNYEEKQKMFNSIISETLKDLKLMKADQQIILIPYLEPFINERYLNNYMLLTLKQHQLYVKNYQRNIEIPYQLYGLKVLRSAFSSLKGIAEDENYEYYYYDGLKKIYIFDKKEYGLVDSFPIIDKYFQGNTSLDDIREVMTYYKQPQQFINQLHELNYLSDKVHKKIMKKLK